MPSAVGNAPSSPNYSTWLWEEAGVPTERVAVDATPLQPIQCACTNLKMAGRIVGRVYDRALAPAGVTVTQYAILINVHRYQPISQMRLATHLGIERTTLYRAVDLLARHGLLTATPTGEGVTKVLALTPRGAQVTRQACSLWERIQQEFQRTFGSARWTAFLHTLAEIRQHFGDQLEDALAMPDQRRRPRARRHH